MNEKGVGKQWKTGQTALQSLPLWKAFVEKEPNARNLANVEELVKKAVALLDRIIETFPTYTLHNRLHAENVIRLMGELLGKDGLEQLRDFECAVLILSAYYHDIGMVFSEKDKNNLTKEDDFKTFKKNHPEVRLKMLSQDDLPLDVAEWYCRWVHPKRVFHYLKKKDFYDLFEWDESNFAEAFGNVCLSHGEDVEFILDSKKIVLDYDDDHDLKFCAILLRLADILDFDNSRSPDEVYEYLALDESKSNKRVSQTEWRKHLCSRGFKFRDKKISFKAEPTHPAVEYDIRKFLKVIENELRSCSMALNYCSDRWRNFRLPDRINKIDIKSQGYIYGEHRFALAQEDVLNLFMGENLYEDPYVFVRELLQNAIDTSRYRRFYENAQGISRSPEQDLVIEVTHWTDNDGYKWVRVDDSGMGMDRNIIEKYLLKIGKSYYNSPDFKADIFECKQKTGKDFTPISRFGIGILSCFIVGDRVEISTKKENGEPVRLSLIGVHGFFTMQIKGEHDLFEPAPMLAKRKDEYGFREKAGTSIAVRLDPAKETEKFDIKEALKKYLLYPDIEVELNGRPIVEAKRKLYEEEWIKNETIKTIELPPEEIEGIERYLDYEFKVKPKVEVIPVNLKNNSSMDELEGMILIYNFVISKQDLESLYEKKDTDKLDRQLGLFLGNTELILTADLFDLDSDHHGKPIDSNAFIICKLERVIHYWRGSKISLSHNGIAILDNLEIDSYLFKRHDLLLGAGTILLYDKLRPNISIARDTLKGLDWDTYSAFYFAFRKTLKKMKRLKYFEELDKHPGKESFMYGKIKNDPLLNSDKGWKVEKIIKVSGGYQSINQILKSDKTKHEIKIDNDQLLYIDSTFFRKDFIFMKTLIAAIIQKNLNIVFNPGEKNFLIKEGEPVMDGSNFDLFPPLFFVPYIDSKKLRKRKLNYPLNLNHNFSRWLVENSIPMSEKYPGIFYAFREHIATKMGDRFLSNVDQEDIVKNVNILIDRLLELDESFDNKQDIRLKVEDFEGDF